MNNSSQTFQVSGISCASCVSLIEKTTKSVAGVTLAQLNFATGSLVVNGNFEQKIILKKINSIGYKIEPILDKSLALSKKKQQDKLYYNSLLIKSAVALVFGSSLMLYAFLGFPMQPNSFLSQISWALVSLISLIIIGFSGGNFYKNAWQALKQRQANMDTLVVIGSTMAWLYSTWVLLLPETLPPTARHFYFEASAMILGLVNLGLALETKSKTKTYLLIDKLFNLQPKMAHLIKKSGAEDKPIESIKIGDLLRVKPAEKIPIDAKIIEGESYINEAMLSGEAMPQLKKAGNLVFGGTVNGKGSLVIKVLKTGEKTTLAQIIALVQKAQNSKAPLSKLVDKIAAIFVPIVLIIALFTGLFWFFLAPDASINFALITSISVLLIACPCALGLATPISVMIAIARAAKSGIIIQDAAALQKSTKISTIALDKTGTVTKGSPEVINFQNYCNEEDNKLLRLAASIEQSSEHPLAKAILTYFEKHSKLKKNTFMPVTQSQAVPGKGFIAKVEGQKFYLGNQKFIESLGLDTSVIKITKELQSTTKVYFATTKNLSKVKLLGCFFITDDLRPDAKKAINQLQKNYNILLLSGDNQKNVADICQKLGIKNFFAELLPNDKAKIIADLQQNGEIVAMVGDGINDAPALAQSDLGFAIGSGTDLAVESAAIVLMRSSLESIATTLTIAKASFRNIKQNLSAAFIYNIVCIPIAAGILFPFTGWLLNPILAALAMSLSSLTVVSNSTRLYFLKV